MFQLKTSYLTAVFVVLSFIVWGHTLAGGFVFDDRNIIEHISLFGDFGNVGHAFMAPFWDTNSGLYRPIVMLSYSLNFMLGAFPEFLHLFNILFYAGLTILIYLFVARWSKNKIIGASTALLFLVLPIHAEVVANISNRNEILAAFFLILALLEVSKNTINYWLAGLWVFLAIGSKESAIAVVPLVFLILFLKEQKINIEILKKHFRTISAVILGAGLYLFLRFLVLGPLHYFNSHTSLIENPLQYTDWYTRVLTGFSVLWMYIQKTIWPVGLCSDYSYNQIPLVHTLGDVNVLLGISAFFIIIIIAVAVWRKAPIVSIALSVVIFSFLPISNTIFAIGTIGGERLFFLPSLGFSIVAAYLGWSLYIFIRSKFSRKNRMIPTLSSIIVATIIVIYAVVSFDQQKVWLNEKALFLSAAACAPESVLSRSNAGAMYYLDGDLVNAKRELEYARSIKPIYSKGLNNLGLVYWKLGEKDKAEKMYLEALQQEFPYPGAYENLIRLYVEENRYADAKRWLHVLLPNQSN